MLDVDGVLVDGRPLDGLRWDHRLSEDMGISSEVLGRLFFARDWDEIVIGKKDFLQALSAFLKRNAKAAKAEDLVDYWFEMDSRIVETVLADCRAARQLGIPIYLTTNQEHMRANYLMETLGLGDEVDGIIYSAQAGCKKPQPEFFVYAARAIGYQPHELLLVDDTTANVEGARKAGWRAVHWDGTERLSAILSRNT